jgi:hypothetical protein
MVGWEGACGKGERFVGVLGRGGEEESGVGEPGEERLTAEGVEEEGSVGGADERGEGASWTRKKERGGV